MRYFGVHCFQVRAKCWNVSGRFDCWNLWVLVRANPGRAGDSVGRPPEGVLILVGLSSRRGGVVAFECCVILLLMASCRLFRDVLDAIR